MLDDLGQIDDVIFVLNQGRVSDIVLDDFQVVVQVRQVSEIPLKEENAKKLKGKENGIGLVKNK